MIPLAPLIASIHNNPTHNHQLRTELDSHANMVVVGKNSTIFDDTGKTCTVNAFYSQQVNLIKYQ